MNRARGALWLVARVTITRRGDVAATVVLAVGAAILTFLALATVAARQVAAAQHRRNFALTPRLAASPGHARESRNVLRAIEPRALPVRRWHEHDIERTYFAGSAGPAIPGVARAPRPGEYFASPALSDLVGRDRTVAALFSGKRRVGTISPAGLVQPHDLRAVVGVPRSTSFLADVTGFGADPSTGLTDYSTLNASVASIVVLAIWLPGFAVLAIVSRLGAARRRRRARALRLLGTPVWATRGIDALDTVVVALPAALLGSLLYALAVARMTSVPGTSLGFSGASARPGLPVYAAIALVITAIAAASGALSLRVRPGEAGAVHARPPTRVVVLGLVLLGAGMAYLFVLPALARVFARATLGLWVACGFVAVGLAISGPRLVMAVSDALAERARGGGTLVGFRLGSRGTTTSSRLASTLCVIVIMLLGGLSFMSLLNGGGSSSWADVLETHPDVPVIANDFGGALSRGEVLALAPGTGAAQMQNSADHRGRLVVYAGCRDLAYLAGSGPAGCTGRAQWIGAAGRRAGRGRLTLTGGRTLALPARSAVMRARGLPDAFDGAVLLPPRLAPSRAGGHGSYFYLRVPSARLDGTLARLSARSPSLELDLGPLDRADPDAKQFPAQLGWLTTGTVLGLVLGALALLAVAFGDRRDRATRMRGMRVIGAPPRELRRAHAIATGGPLLILGWTATLCGWLTVRGIAAFDDRAQIGLQPIALTGLAVSAAAVAIVALTWREGVRAAQRGGDAVA